MTETDFAPIKITGCDEESVERSSDRKGMYVVPLSLSERPPGEWSDVFEDVWRARRKLASKPKPRAYFRKGELMIECPLADLKLHFLNLRADVETVNEKYSEQLRRKAEKDSRKRLKREEKERAEKGAIHAALEELDFS